jgi:hypothetical protein
VGVRGEDAQALSETTNERGWPLVVRRARPEDSEVILSFATATWHGWDYIPNALPVWLEAADGAFLVGTVGEPGGVDAEGESLTVGQVVAITRVAVLSPTEAWLEGIRVDPRVRGMGVAADLQIAELHWVEAQGSAVLRYATGASNEASHRLGAKDDINLIARFKSWLWSATGEASDDDDEPSAFDEASREVATARRRRAMTLLTDAGLAVKPATTADMADLWRRVDADPTFEACQRLYEARSWAMAELTDDLFRRHVERGEVLLAGDASTGWALAILVSEQLPSEESALRLSLLVGDGDAAAHLVDQIRQLTTDQIRFRVPAGAPMVAGHMDAFKAAGFVSPDDWEMHILAREMSTAQPIPVADPSRVILADAPDRLTPPRW